MPPHAPSSRRRRPGLPAGSREDPATTERLGCGGVSPFDPPVSVVLALWAPLPSSRGIAVVEGADGAHEVDDSASPWGLGRLSLGRWLAAFGPLSRVSAALASPADPLPGLAAAAAAYNQLAGVWETMRAVHSPDSTAADHISRLIDQLNQRQGSRHYD